MLAGDVDTFSMEKRYIRKDGTVVWCNLTVGCVRDAGGAVESFISVVEDISERKAAEERLRQSEERYRGIFEHAGTGIAISDLAGRFESCNPAYAAMLGYSERELRRVNVRDLIHPDDRDANIAELERLLAQDVPSFEVVNRYVRKDGAPLWVHKRISLLRDASGAPSHRIGLVTDMSAQKQIEESLRAARDTFASMVEHSPFGIYVVDADFRLSLVSQGRTPRVRGVGPLIGRNFEAVLRHMWGDGAEDMLAQFRNTLETGAPHRNPNWVARRADLGTTEAYDWQTDRIVGLDGRFAVVCQFYDLSERRAYEEKIETLMREVNHRSKNLLALVQSIAMQTATANSDFFKRFDDRLRALAASHDLLVHGDWQGADLAALIRSQFLPFSDLIGSRIVLSGPAVNLAPKAAQTLGMALHELTTNAVKYGALSDHKGRIEISWRIEQEPEGARFAMSWIERDGPAVATPPRQGYGQRVARTIVARAFQGSVSLDFAASGVRWTLHCQLSAVAAPTPTAAARPASLRKAPSRVARSDAVLVVEDDALLALNIAAALEGAGHKVMGPVSSVAQAFHLLEEQEPSFAILDVNLGAETAEPIARLLTEADVPFATVSGYSRSQQPAVFQGRPFFAKPVHIPSLLQEVERARRKLVTASAP